MPDYDKEAVYPSDMKKVFAWYQMLIDRNLLDFSEPETEKGEQAAQPEKAEKAVKPETPKKPRAKKAE